MNGTQNPNGMTALSELNALRAEARKLGIEKPNTMKRDELKARIEEAKSFCPCGIVKEKCTAHSTEDDPFDEIDPAVEGDHLTEETVADAKAARDITREAWLLSAVELLIPLLEQAGATNVRSLDLSVSVGFPSKSVRKRIGEHWHAESSSDGKMHHMFISPLLDDPIQVLGVLAHELIHADDNGESQHGGHFRRVALALGLEGKMTATVVGDNLTVLLGDILKELGEYPHIKLNLGDQKKQTTRMIKVECQDTECPYLDSNGGHYVLRLTKKWAEIGLPSCPCGTEMTLAE